MALSHLFRCIISASLSAAMSIASAASLHLGSDSRSSLHALSINASYWGSEAVLFSIPVGDEGLHYGGERGPESEIWGTAGFRLSSDGTFLVPDTAANTILRYAPDGSRLEPIRVDTGGGVVDVAASGSTIFALDAAGPEPKIYRLSTDGTLLETITLPDEVRAKGLSGINVNEQGQVMAESWGGASTLRLNGTGQAAETARPDRLGIQTPNLSDGSADHSIGFVIKDGSRIPIKVDHILGSLSVIGTAADESLFVLVEELSETPTLYVDQRVQHYSKSGILLGVARVPVAQRCTYVAHGVVVARDANVYALVTHPDRVDVVRLSLKQRLRSILPEVRDPAMSDGSAALGAASCMTTRDQMISTGWTYVNNQAYLTNANLNGYCPGRIKPHYLGSAAGYYPSVAYCWGGFELPGDYNSSMSRGLVAGDLNDSRISSCPHGVDCSGFVSRCWGTARYTTTTLPAVSTAITVSQAQRGDILNLSGSHVAMIESIVSNGVMTLEATAYNQYDRVVYIYNGWSRFAGYQFYRFNGACDQTAQAHLVVTSSLSLSSGGPYYVGQSISAYFTITNRGGQTVSLSRLLVGGRLNGDQSCSGGCPDFSSAYNVTLSPGQSYYYGGTQSLSRAGTYSFFVAYQRADGSWVTNVDTENGTVNSRTITVQIQQSGPPSLSGHTPSYPRALPYNQTVYFLASA